MLVAVGCVEVYWPAVHTVVVAQLRSEVYVLGTDWYWADVHWVSGVQVVLAVAVQAPVLKVVVVLHTVQLVQTVDAAASEKLAPDTQLTQGVAGLESVSAVPAAHWKRVQAPEEPCGT